MWTAANYGRDRTQEKTKPRRYKANKGVPSASVSNFFSKEAWPLRAHPVIRSTGDILLCLVVGPSCIGFPVPLEQDERLTSPGNCFGEAKRKPYPCGTGMV